MLGILTDVDILSRNVDKDYIMCESKELVEKRAPQVFKHPGIRPTQQRFRSHAATNCIVFPPLTSYVRVGARAEIERWSNDTLPSLRIFWP